jgi:hypothetical protein
MHPSLRFLFALAVLPASTAHGGDVFKCTDASGQVSFTDRPCPVGSETEAMRLRGGGMVGGDSSESRAKRRACAVLARPAWDLLPREASGQLSDSESITLREARDALAIQCRQRMTASPLAFECREQLGALTRATAAAVDPAKEADRDRLQAEFDRRCSEEAVLEDIGRHLRDLGDPGVAQGAPSAG